MFSDGWGSESSGMLLTGGSEKLVKIDDALILGGLDKRVDFVVLYIQR